MKLLFPNDEHAPVLLADGAMVVGSAAGCAIRLAAPGVADRHCELLTKSGQTRLRPLTDAAATVLNGRQVVGEAVIKPGDLVLFGRIGCRVVASEQRGQVAPPRPAADAGDDDAGHTRVRMAMPKYLLRGVSGPTFGKIYAMVGAMSVGRNSDCDICIPIDEISRNHAKLQSGSDGVVVEDLASANGTFVNDQRVHAGTLVKPGDEVRFDTVRFLLMAPAQEMQRGSAARLEVASPPARSSATALWIVAGLVVLAAIVLVVLRYLGDI
ncbi:MAG TPA: FHA domain-containing protein [Rhodanobacteraceae bacterium]|jgi:pSer/pThr/pTyr-binding forkhead associated (FHA) protein|nr:FHA domain-containing protein [Rhodanobacteraceae bacterium]